MKKKIGFSSHFEGVIGGSFVNSILPRINTYIKMVHWSRKCVTSLIKNLKKSFLEFISDHPTGTLWDKRVIVAARRCGITINGLWFYQRSLVKKCNLKKLSPFNQGECMCIYVRVFVQPQRYHWGWGFDSLSGHAWWTCVLYPKKNPKL